VGSIEDYDLSLRDPYARYFSPGIDAPGGFRSAPDKLKGKRVRIPKGTLIHSVHPQDPNTWFPLKRTTIITVFSSSPGYVFDPYHQPDRRAYRHAELVWPGSGGYWKNVRLRDVEILDDINGIPKVTPDEVQHFDDYLTSQLIQSRPLPTL
jgi:hypothetical protein